VWVLTVSKYIDIRLNKRKLHVQYFLGWDRFDQPTSSCTYLYDLPMRLLCWSKTSESNATACTMPCYACTLYTWAFIQWSASWTSEVNVAQRNNDSIWYPHGTHSSHFPLDLLFAWVDTVPWIWWQAASNLHGWLTGLNGNSNKCLFLATQVVHFIYVITTCSTSDFNCRAKLRLQHTWNREGACHHAPNFLGRPPLPLLAPPSPSNIPHNFFQIFYQMNLTNGPNPG
jgi:hypothetical protein